MLIAYMAWMSVLRKQRLRRGQYAEPLPVELLPMLLTTKLGASLTPQMGMHLSHCARIMDGGKAAQTEITALRGGRGWLSRVRRVEGGCKEGGRRVEGGWKDWTVCVRK